MVFVAICQYFFLRKKTFITELLQTTFHIIKNFSLGIKYFCGFCYKTSLLSKENILDMI